ncbi:MAG: alpha/beta hydrolase [Gemmatimonadales bacterium]|nr:alpha/beta hydrolase [Gemmatimonadales bacterium]
MNKWLRRLIVGGGILIAALAFLVLIASLVVRQVAVRRAERDFPPPGRLVEIDGRLSHIHCTGRGTPTILLESGLDDRGSWGWDHILDELSQVSRVCTYDRAGIIWSEPREGPRDAERIAGELHAILASASEAPPYVMVGHSLGGLLVRVYDRRYPGEAVGFVFVDASHPEQDRRFPADVRRLIERRKSEPDRRWLFRILAPYRIFAPERPTARTAYWWRSFPEGVLGEGRAIDAMSEQAARTGPLGDHPVVVLTAGVPLPMPGLSVEGNAAMRRTWLELHGELADLSTNSDHRIVEGAGHYVHWDRPDAVVAAIRDVVRAVREPGPLQSGAAEDGR